MFYGEIGKLFLKYPCYPRFLSGQMSFPLHKEHSAIVMQQNVRRHTAIGQLKYKTYVATSNNLPSYTNQIILGI